MVEQKEMWEKFLGEHGLEPVESHWSDDLNDWDRAKMEEWVGSLPMDDELREELWRRMNVLWGEQEE